MKCKNCGNKFEPIRFLQKYCLDSECIKVWVVEANKKQWQKKKKQMHQDLTTLQDIIKAAQIVFNLYIRLRDAGNVCISCQKEAKKENAGHFWNANNHWNVRFDERNVHLQCEHCNTYLSGNLIEYQKQLINKIGTAEYLDLEQEAKKTRKFSKEEVKNIISVYKGKIKELKNN